MRVLSIDGGGIRGLIPALVLADIERRTERPICQLFELIAGTSTGGILALALTRAEPGDAARPALSAQDAVALYEAEGPRIFSRDLVRRITTADGVLDERYDDEGLREALDRYLGASRLAAALTDVLVTAYEIERRMPFFFRSARARADATYDYAIADAARATAAAPTYFEPVRLHAAAGQDSYALIDGGVFATNPAMCAYAEVAARGLAPLPGEAPEGDELLIASLGTGRLTRRLEFERVRGWGQLEWARPILDVVFDGVSDTIDFQLRQLLPEGRAVRLQTELRDASDDLDDASAGNLRALRREGERLLSERAGEIDALCAALVA